MLAKHGKIDKDQETATSDIFNGQFATLFTVQKLWKINSRIIAGFQLIAGFH